MGTAPAPVKDPSGPEVQPQLRLFGCIGSITFPAVGTELSHQPLGDHAPEGCGDPVALHAHVQQPFHSPA